MTADEREELLALVEAMPEERRRALLSNLRRYVGVGLVRRPLSPLGPIAADDADQIMAAITEDRDRIDADGW